jgi:hypothetical protein
MTVISSLILHLGLKSINVDVSLNSTYGIAELPGLLQLPSLLSIEAHLFYLKEEKNWKVFLCEYAIFLLENAKSVSSE